MDHDPQYGAAKPLPGFGWLREPINALTHGVGALAAVAGLVVLLVMAGGDPMRTVAAAIYGASLVVLFLASTLLHALKVGASALRGLRVFDHASIFGLIAGSYTPIALVTLQQQHSALGWTLFSVVWGLAVLGIVFKVVWIGAPRWVSVGLYLGMGWLSLVALRPLVTALPGPAIGWLVAGGLAYSLGAVIYGAKRPDPFPKVFGYHELWHVFVLMGASAHYVLIARYVVGA
ncbi:MAG: hemolysin III family protein [Trueperaceae bacterium]|jgi:hemolysin III|nr:hemolysin III family protein [Trueperaceae bacterium]